jgi:hypothetical protein
MTLQGTVVNGAIVLDGTPALPEGTRVWVELDDTDTPHDPGMEPGTREAELASLRESIADMKAGRGRPAREMLKEIAVKYNLPLEPGE